MPVIYRLALMIIMLGRLAIRSGAYTIFGFAGRLHTVQLKMRSVAVSADADQISIKRIDILAHCGPGKAT
jgi:hypothetical protein